MPRGCWNPTVWRSCSYTSMLPARAGNFGRAPINAPGLPATNSTAISTRHMAVADRPAHDGRQAGPAVTTPASNCVLRHCWPGTPQVRPCRAPSTSPTDHSRRTRASSLCPHQPAPVVASWMHCAQKSASPRTSMKCSPQQLQSLYWLSYRAFVVDMFVHLCTATERHTDNAFNVYAIRSRWGHKPPVQGKLGARFAPRQTGKRGVYGPGRLPAVRGRSSNPPPAHRTQTALVFW